MEVAVLVVPVALGFLVPRWWVLVVALLIPVGWVAVVAGLSTTARDGTDNWALVLLPFMCAASVAVCAGAIWVRTRRRSG